MSTQARPKRLNTYWLLVAPAALVVLSLYVAPIANVLFLSVTDPAPGLGNYAKIFESDTIATLILRTIRLCLITTVCAVTLGYVVAYAMLHALAHVRRRMMAVLLMSFWISVLVRSFAWLMLLGHNGLLNNALIGAGLGCRVERQHLAGHVSGQDHLGICLRNSNEYLESMIGALMARAAPFNINYRFTAAAMRPLLVATSPPPLALLAPLRHRHRPGRRLPHRVLHRPREVVRGHQPGRRRDHQLRLQRHPRAADRPRRTRRPLRQRRHQGARSVARRGQGQAHDLSLIHISEPTRPY